ncbi:hypothetical protein [Teredinibacter sp. KSP-S5-2]|uniref:hypothetical protein n=1 Tax=Teredinibacter sp. KSP-S5-2 TaxID=3034506 RepID=UPI0029347D11|nr:hypothetical protein [Teredinibacter sp. KSP-S5-2]WNO09988.1 hypothetical protein P5V12_02265 [Teredinibacter sp. KSP-S5-2]
MKKAIKYLMLTLGGGVLVILGVLIFLAFRSGAALNNQDKANAVALTFISSLYAKPNSALIELFHEKAFEKITQEDMVLVLEKYKKRYIGEPEIVGAQLIKGGTVEGYNTIDEIFYFGYKVKYSNAIVELRAGVVVQDGEYSMTSLRVMTEKFVEDGT